MTVKIFATRLAWFLRSELLLWYARWLGYSLCMVTSDSDRHAVAQLRFRVYRAEGYIDARDFPKGVLLDKYTPYSCDVLVRHLGVPVGGLRLTTDSELGFPTEALFNIERVSDRRRVAELGRLVLDRDHRQRARGARVAMFGMGYVALKHSRSIGIDAWLVNMPERLASSFTQLGVRAQGIPEGPPARSHIDARSIIAGYFAKNALSPYLLSLGQITTGSIVLKPNDASRSRRYDLSRRIHN